MKFSKKWLNEYVDLSEISNEMFVDKLTMSGFEVESVENLGQKLNHVVVCKIVNIEKHPNADNLQVCKVDLGGKFTQIITNAKNVFVGAIVPVALDGAHLPIGIEIKPTKMRGVDSFGMFCGPEEIGLNLEGYEGIYILNDEYKCEIGQDIASVLGVDDYIYDVSILSNRPDCNSVYMFAKELSAIFNREFKPLKLDYKTINKKCKNEINVEIKTNNCLAYKAAIVDNIKNVSSPKWMQERLSVVGIRPINAIVDITNYVLTEIGQPMHAFDFSKVCKGNLIVRQAESFEEIVALNDEKYVLDNSVMVISDNKQPLALAGVMGGKESGINDATNKIIFESACFARGNIRNTVRKFGLSSDSSTRFERGVAPAFSELGLNRALHFIDELNLGQIYMDNIIVNNYEKSDNEIVCDIDKINNILALNLKGKEIAGLLSKIDIKCEISGKILKCNIPEYRNDLFTYQDIAEEIVRLYGFDKIESKESINTSYTQQVTNEKYEKMCKIKKMLCSIGLNEIITAPLENFNINEKLLQTNNNSVHIKNALSAEYECLRTDSISSMINVIKGNNSRSNKNMKLFEFGKVYFKIDNSYIEEDVLSLAQTGKNANFFDVKGWIELIAQQLGVKLSYVAKNVKNYLNPYKSAEILCNDEVVGFVGEIHPQLMVNFNLTENIVFAEIKFNEIKADEKLIKEFTPYSKFQPIVRDFTFLVPIDMDYNTLYKEIVSSSSKYCVNIELVDVYTGENVDNGFKSVTFKLTYEKLDDTFKDEEIKSIVDKFLRALNYKLGIKLKDEIV